VIELDALTVDDTDEWIYWQILARLDAVMCDKRYASKQQCCNR